MGWGTDFVYNEFISRKVFSNKFELENYIVDLEEEIIDYRRILVVYAVANPKIILDKNDSRSIADGVTQEVAEILDYYEEAFLNLYKAKKYLEVFIEKKEKT